MLLAVVIMVALVLIALAVAAPVVARDLRRDKEIESQHRMQQYVRAIQLYQRKFPNQYPASIKVLEGTNNIRYLRHQYVDPLTGKTDYKLIHQGEQKTTIKIFFGQELAGLAANLGSAAGDGFGGWVGAPVGATGSSSCGGGGRRPWVRALGAAGTVVRQELLDPREIRGVLDRREQRWRDVWGQFRGCDCRSRDVAVGELGDRADGQTTYETWEYWYDPRIEALKKGVSITGGGLSSQSGEHFRTEPGWEVELGRFGLNGEYGSYRSWKRDTAELVLDRPHDPAGGDNGTDKEHEAEGAEANHHPCSAR